MIDIQRNYEPRNLPDDTERFEGMYNKSATVRRLNIRRDNFVSLLSNAIQICQWWSFDLTEDNKQKSIKALKLAAKAGEVIFRLGLTPDKEQPVVIDGLLDGDYTGTYNGKGLLSGGRLHAMRWQEAFFCAAIVRDKEAMDSLLKFPVSLMRKCSSTNAESEYLFTELIQSVYLNEPSEQFEQKLVKVLKCAAEEEEDPWVLYCTGAKLNFIMAAYMTNNETTPTQSMSNALTQYWDYHERHTDHGYQQPDFYMPIALLGLACLAKDNGEQVDVRSDFIPQFYIDGDYL